MTPTQAFLLVFAIGVIAGLRTMTAPAVTSWAACLHWIHLQGTPLAFMGSVAAVVVFTLLACSEFVIDKLPNTPSRLDPRGLTARTVVGALTGAVLALASTQSLILGALLGVVGALAGSFAGYHFRTRMVQAVHTPDIVGAVLEDLVAIGGGLLIVSRFQP
jgi:uncharacterized membrane protein